MVVDRIRREIYFAITKNLNFGDQMKFFISVIGLFFIVSVNAKANSWICYNEDQGSGSQHQKFGYIGYGSDQNEARSATYEACKSSGNGPCLDQSFAKCEMQSDNPKAFRCYTMEYGGNGQKYWGEGASVTEAGYFARRDCFGSARNYCEKVFSSSCQRQ